MDAFVLRKASAAYGLVSSGYKTATGSGRQWAFALDRIIAKEIPEHGMDFEDYADNAPRRIGSARRISRQ